MNRLATLSRTLLAAASLSLLASSAFAQGLNLSWNDCGSFGTEQRNFACGVNTGVNTMYCSAVTGVVMPQLNGMAGVLHLQVNQALISDWWKIGGTGVAPNCRAGTAMTADFSFIANVNCVDPWQGAAAGGLNYEHGFNGANRARIRTVCAIAGSIAINGTDEHYFLKVTVNNSRSTGTGACAGCSDGACIVFNSLLVTQPAGVGDFLIINPLARRHVLWQPGGSTIGGLGCPAQVPTRDQTWGQVKSLYR